MPRKPPLRRFILLVLLPAVATCLVLVQIAQQTRDSRRAATLSRVGGMLAVAVQTELAEAWSLLETRAEAVSSVDTTLVAVRRALDGDTVRSLAREASSVGQGARASVLLPRGDTLVSATALVRSPTLAGLVDVAELDAGLYLRGRLLQASGGPAAATLPDEFQPSPGWHPELGLWVSPATASTGSAAAELSVAIRRTTRRRAVASTRMLIASTGSLLLALVLVASSGGRVPAAPPAEALAAAAGVSRRRHPDDAGGAGRVVAGVVLVALTTVVVAGWVALGESRVAAADGARELEFVGDLLDARGLMANPVRARGWAGSPVYRVAGDSLMSAPGEPPPAFVASLPSPDPGRPESGTAAGGVRWRVVASGDGRTILLGSPLPTPPLVPLALGGALIVLLGCVAVLRSASVEDVFAG